ncbi:MAG: hypothetical protein E7410_05190 [Ruminococcaceae bacterium]|nr:hypothetical protein [Oscillospiraceae bacterium]
MKNFYKNKTLKGFVLGFLVCAVLTGTVAYAGDIYESISVIMGKMNIYLGDTPMDIDNIVYNGTTYVPLRDFSKKLGKSISYDPTTDSVTILDKEQAQIVSREVAFLVNGQPVRVDFFSQMLNWYKLNAGGMSLSGEEYNAFKDFVKDEVVIMEITKQYADELGLVLFGNDIKNIEKNIEIYANNFGGMEAFKKLLSDNGITYDVYYEIQKNYALRSKLSDIMTDEITTYDVIDYYHENKDMFKVEKVVAKQIFLSSTDDSGYALSAAASAQKEDKLWGIYNQIKSGKATFDECMFLYSEDSGLKAYPDGYTFARGEMVTAFENMAFSLGKGEMSEVFESELGYHIILVTDRLEVYESFEKVRDDIFNSLRNEAYYKVVEPKISHAYVYVAEDTYNNI